MINPASFMTIIRLNLSCFKPLNAAEALLLLKPRFARPAEIITAWREDYRHHHAEESLCVSPGGIRRARVDRAQSWQRRRSVRES